LLSEKKSLLLERLSVLEKKEPSLLEKREFFRVEMESLPVEVKSVLVAQLRNCL
jgi:N-acetylglutamate synthase-like GNAT family acetyltransferase